MKSLTALFLLPALALSIKQNCTCTCPCKPDGLKLKNLINCFATWNEDAASDGNSHLDNCEPSDVIYCKTTGSPKFCVFDGTNNLMPTSDQPDCYWSCAMHSCDAFLVGHTLHQVDCIIDLFKD